MTFLSVMSWSHGGLTWGEWQDMPDWLREAAEEWAVENSERSKEK